MSDRLKFLAFRLVPVAVVGLGTLAGVLGWQEISRRQTDTAATEAVAAARETTSAMLSYQADTVDNDLKAVRDRLTGPFVDSYTALIDDVVIPGARQKKISAAANVAAAASVSATPTHAVALLFVDQTVTMGTSPPTTSASSVRVTLDKVGGQWLVSGFDPV